MSAAPVAAPRLGLGANWRQFSLLMVVSAFVGAMVGIERTVLPLLAESEFGIASASAALSFIVAFGIVKAATNLAAGALAERWGRKRLLVAGWLAGLPVPLMLIWAPAWGWVVAANVLLGVNQGLTWSMTVVMKIDLVGPKRRGLALGLNESAGYGAVAAAALATGMLAAAYGPRPAPFLLGLGFAAAGLLLSVTMVRETRGHAALEAAGLPAEGGARIGLREAFRRTTYREPSLSAASQAGLVNNLNDGMVWGLLPIFLAGQGLSIGRIGVVAAAYPAAWALSQLGTGALSDRYGRKGPIVAGLWLQAAGIASLTVIDGYASWVAAAIAMGIGTALVYPTLLAVVGDVASPGWRASAMGVYRFWRDLGYAAGALLSAAVADVFGIRASIAVVAAVTAASGFVVVLRMAETSPARLDRRDGASSKPRRAVGHPIRNERGAPLASGSRARRAGRRRRAAPSARR